MSTIRVYDIAHKRALITRESAEAMRQLLAQDSADELTLDFSGIEAVTPSFVDEALAVIEAAVGRERIRLKFVHLPTRLSSKFAAIGRSRQLDIEESPDGSWVIAPSQGHVMGNPRA